ncbi:MAG: mannose-1-phosphate guanylyltransferase [Bacteroidales bacterium]|nr:mannose-1-phosphate guanylyltransferase [Bacteroidales bacterium]
MAGGIGSRFWPLSKNDHPKQFIDVLGTGKSFIRATYERFMPLVESDHFVVVTNAAYKALVLEHLPELKPSQVLCEPMRRNTAPCIAYAAYHILSQCSDADIVVTPADHLVTNEAEFCHVVATGFNFVEQPDNAGALLTIGIKPSRPETGYGYIEVAHGQAATGSVCNVSAFKEKPDHATALRFLEAGNYLWNSGIFVWTLKGILNAFASHLPAMKAVFDEGRPLFGTDAEQQFINDNFARCENISVDYGVMERSSLRYTIPADFGWSDIGTWGSLYTHVAKDAAGNAVSGNVVTADCSGSVINIEQGVEAIVQGVDGCLVAYRDKSLLVCRLHDEQQIKQWVEQLPPRHA